MLCTAHAGGGSHSCGLGALSRSAEAGSECCGRETASPRHSPPPTLTRTRLPWAPSRPRALGGTLQQRRIACTVLAGDEYTGLLAAAGCGEKRRRPDVCDRRLARRATLGLWARGRALWCASLVGEYVSPCVSFDERHLLARVWCTGGRWRAAYRGILLGEAGRTVMRGAAIWLLLRLESGARGAWAAAGGARLSQHRRRGPGACVAKQTACGDSVLRRGEGGEGRGGEGSAPRTPLCTPPVPPPPPHPSYHTYFSRFLTTSSLLD